MDSFLIVGMGRFGSSLACELAGLGHEVLVIDKDEELVSEIADSVTHAVIGDARDEDVIRSVGAANFDVAVVAIAGSIEDSIIITVMLKELGIKKVVAKAHSELHMRVLEKIGADVVVFPERDMGKRLAHRLSSRNIIDFIELSDECSIVEAESKEDWVGRSLSELSFRSVYGLNVIALKNTLTGEINIAPDARYVIKKADVLVVVGANSDIKKLRDEK